MDILVNGLATVGAAVILMVIIIIGAFIIDGIKEGIQRVKYNRQVKHRFDKSPTAKCYCKDCEAFYKANPDDRDGDCFRHSRWRVADCWFCWDARPKKYNAKGK